MTRLKRVALGGAVAALVMTGAASKSFAIEGINFDNQLRGATIGLPLGAAPPPGLYSGLESVAFVNDYYRGSGNGGPSDLYTQALAWAVPIVWSTGWNIFGASLVLDVVQAGYTATSWTGSADGNAAGNGFAGTAFIMANTTWDAGLSWNLGSGLFGSLAFSVIGPDGTATQAGNPLPNPDWWTFMPHGALSYLGNNWVLSANVFYTFNTNSKGQCCIGNGGLGAGVPPVPLLATAANGFHSGDELFVDLTGAYKIGKWEIGAVGYIRQQTTGDSPGGGIACTYGVGGLCGNLQDYAAGALVGYDFGPVDLQAWFTDSFYCRNSGGCGLTVWSRLGFRLWGPEAAPAAKPLVSKN